VSQNCIHSSIGLVVDVRGTDRRPEAGEVVRGCLSTAVGNGGRPLNSAG